jgi:hypothetical protein
MLQVPAAVVAAAAAVGMAVAAEVAAAAAVEGAIAFLAAAAAAVGLVFVCVGGVVAWGR